MPAIKGKRPQLHDSIADRMGIGFDSLSIAKSIAGSMGLPIFDDVSAAARSRSREMGLADDEARRAKNAFDTLDGYEKSLVMSVLRRKGECDEADVRDFLKVHPGVRELRLRNLLSRVWTDGDWRAQLEADAKAGTRSALERAELIDAEISCLADAIRQIGGKCEIEYQQFDKLIEAICMPGELTDYQLAFFLSKVQDKRTSGLSSDDVCRFRDWLANIPQGQLRELWRFGGQNIMSVASIIHKMRFTGEALSYDENSHIPLILKTPPGEEVNPEPLNNMMRHGITPPVPEEIGGGQEAILRCARMSAEFETLLEIFQIRGQSVSAAIDRSAGFSKGSLGKTEGHMRNDDSFTSLNIYTSDRGKISIDAVFDGVSGEAGGYVASGLSRDALEISALAGWIRSPEDVRRTIILADLIIHSEKKRYGFPSMGTTAAISYLEGDKLFGIHVGDSDYMVIRNGAVAFRSQPHGVGNVIWSSIGGSVRMLDINNSPTYPKVNALEPFILQPGDVILTLTDGITDVLCEHEYGLVMAFGNTEPAAILEAIVRLADSRKDGATTYPTLCGCSPIGGKDDDITGFARKFEGKR